MAGKVRPGPSYQFLVAQACYANALAPKSVPVDDTLRLRIHLAILQRLRKFHPDEYRHCMEAVTRIAKFEAVDGKYATPDERAHAIEEELNLIAAAVPSRGPHNKGCIRTQQALFRDYFTVEAYLNNLTMRSRLAWFQSHWDQLNAITALTPCLCRYHTSFTTFAECATKRPDYLKRIANASDFFLAFTHRLRTVSPENLRKCLKTKS